MQRITVESVEGFRTGDNIALTSNGRSVGGVIIGIDHAQPALIVDWLPVTPWWRKYSVNLDIAALGAAASVAGPGMRSTAEDAMSAVPTMATATRATVSRGLMSDSLRSATRHLVCHRKPTSRSVAVAGMRESTRGRPGDRARDRSMAPGGRIAKPQRRQQHERDEALAPGPGPAARVVRPRDERTVRRTQPDQRDP